LVVGEAMVSSMRKSTSLKFKGYDVKIELYGFDMGSGLPNLEII
jgi:hypothetical protein